MNFQAENIAVTVVLIVTLGFFIKVWINGVKSANERIEKKLDEAITKIEKELKSKVDIFTCERVHRIIDRHAHSHGSLGTSGEVIDQQSHNK